jgi:hypothetical protein
VRDRDRPPPIGHRLWVDLGEVREQLGIDVDRALRSEHADGRRRERFRQRVREVDPVRGVRRPPALGDDVAVPGDHQAVQAEAAPLSGVDEGEQPRGIDAARRWCGTSKAGHHADATATSVRVIRT